ncbi:NADAR family protein [Salininema proteolyticum]|uniref:NADAR family protein n=1 Tax=Salininema proteolyticum TaxID=1607685 RepID=A0ABV8U5B1_9ACTN
MATALPLGLSALIRDTEAGRTYRHLRFWSHRPTHPTRPGRQCLSQWRPSPFTEDGITYPTAEHYMMARKARLFGDERSAEKILGKDHPGAAQGIGRSVRGFDEQTWRRHRFDIVVDGSLLKFRQNRAMGEYLVATGDHVLVEASPIDRNWGIGMAEDDEGVDDPRRWRGANLLGFALMAAREVLLAEGFSG